MLKKYLKAGTLGIALIVAPMLAPAEIVTQVPGDINGDAIPDPKLPNGANNPQFKSNVKGQHVAAGDGFAQMADGKHIYIFGFRDVTGEMSEHVMHAGMLGAQLPAPTITAEEGQQFYLMLSNVGMAMRPDLFDAHSVHWHGFPQAAPVFDGMPDGALAINMGSTYPYYYNVKYPGTYMYHCHVEATEHMQMGMLGNLYVFPKQNKLSNGANLKGFTHRTGYKYAYNDGDGSTFYNVDAPVQITSMDREFHDASETVQTLPFALMRDDYGLINGRGYPDTVNPGALPPPVGQDGEELNGGKTSQPMTALIVAKPGDKVLLRISNLSVTRMYTLSSPSVPMKVVGHCARLLKGPDGKKLFYDTSTLQVGSGESFDAILDLTGAASGDVFPIYTTNLHYLSNNEQDFGGIMTEVRVQ